MAPAVPVVADWRATMCRSICAASEPSSPTTTSSCAARSPARSSRSPSRRDRRCSKGDLLAEIDPRPYQAQLDQAIANRDRDQAQLVNAQANLNRYVPLAAKGLCDTATGRYPEGPAGPAAGDGEVGRGASSSRRERTSSYTRLTSPIDGVTGHSPDRRGQHHPSDRCQRPGRRHADRSRSR